MAVNVIKLHHQTLSQTVLLIVTHLLLVMLLLLLLLRHIAVAHCILNNNVFFN